MAYRFRHTTKVKVWLSAARGEPARLQTVEVLVEIDPERIAMQLAGPATRTKHHTSRRLEGAVVARLLKVPMGVKP